MKRLAGWGFPVLGCALLAAAATGVFFGGAVGIAQVRVGGELGWQGQAVAGVVNPLTITVENEVRSILVGTVTVEQTSGSGWRGESLLRLEAPVLLSPGGQRQFVFPWPVEAGSPPLRIAVRVDGRVVADVALPVRARVAKGVAVIGVADPGAEAVHVVFLAPEDLPLDPFLYASWAKVRIAPGAVLAPRARDALRAWAAYSGGVVEGVPVPPVWTALADQDLETELERRQPRPAPVGAILGSAVLYLVALGYVLPPLARRGGHRVAGFFLPLCLGVALLYPLLSNTPHYVTVVQYSMSRSDVAWFGLDTLGIQARDERTVELVGHWVERPQAGMESALLRIEWVWGDDGVRTVVHLRQGKTAILWSYGRPWAPPDAAWTAQAGEGERLARAEPGWGPALQALSPVGEEGNRIAAERVEDRRGDEGWTIYRLRWEPGG